MDQRCENSQMILPHGNNLTGPSQVGGSPPHSGTPSQRGLGQQRTDQASMSPSQSAAAATSEQPALQNVDIDKELSDFAAKKGGGGDYRKSIVDFLKLLDLDSSLKARKELLYKRRLILDLVYVDA